MLTIILSFIIATQMKIKHHKTEHAIYNEHLVAFKPTPFDQITLRYAPQPKLSICRDLQTNYCVTLNNPYAFILLHLKKKCTTKNILNINIPDVCIFHAHVPFELVYSEGGFIRGIRNKDGIKMRDVYLFFKNRWKVKESLKDQPSFACFQGEEFQLLTDVDLLICSQKFKNDTFFKKLHYLRNKLNLTEGEIEVEFQYERDCKYAGQATQSFLGYKDEHKFIKQHGIYEYLRFCNEKIALFLNYEHHIRLHRGLFYYAKSRHNNQYYLVNIKQLKFANLTQAIKEHDHRKKLKEDERNRRLTMSPEKQEKYRPFERNFMVKEIQKQMNQEMYKLAESMNIQMKDKRNLEEEKTELAFKKLYPQVTIKLRDFLMDTRFKNIRSHFNDKDKRKPFSRTSKPLIRFYKTQKIVRSATQQQKCSKIYAE